MKKDKIPDKFRDIMARYEMGFGRSEIVGQNEDRKYKVSTVLPNDMMGRYESMVFEKRETSDSWNYAEPVVTRYYETREQAETGHELLKEKYVH
jgi:hypothetical protein